jgi:hypothetical protein
MSDDTGFVVSFADSPDVITHNVRITALRIPLTA